MANVHKIISFALLGLAVVGWIIYLAGVGRSEDVCVQVARGNMQPFSNSNTNNVGRRLLSHGRSLLDTVVDDCGMQVSFYWWTVFLQLFTLIGLFMLTAGLGFAKKLQQPFTAFLYINSALLCIVARDVILEAYKLRNTDGNLPDAIRATSAGVVLCLVFNFVWIIFSAFQPPTSEPTVAPQAHEGPGPK